MNKKCSVVIVQVGLGWVRLLINQTVVGLHYVQQVHARIPPVVTKIQASDRDHAVANCVDAHFRSLSRSPPARHFGLTGRRAMASSLVR